MTCGRHARRARRELGWLTAMLLLPSPALAESPLIPPNATAVLISGVAGDLESDTLYQANLQNWMEIAQQSHAARVLVLCESPETLKQPPMRETKVLRADRNIFLSLKEQVAGTTNPLVMIAWGHGGRQGQTPVLHVRGPRLTPADFKQLADSTTQPSTWILMFRGSGTFARELAGPDRTILSSEHSTQFASDPGGLQLLTALLREKPDRPLREVAEALGRETVHWYEERKLARTEEPTLWFNEGAPRLLARIAEKSAPKEPTTVGDNNPPARGETNATVLPLTETGSAPPWSGIARVRAEDYPDAEAVLLRKRASYTIGSNPAILAEQEQFIQILTAEGKHLADFDISYSPPLEEVNFLDCEVLQPGGRLFRVNPEAVREAGGGEPEDYRGSLRRMFSLPGAVPGAILHVRYQNVWKKFPLPHVSVKIPMESPLPARETILEVTAPGKSPFHFAAENLTAPEPEVKQSAYGATYRWNFGTSGPALRETLSSPGQRACMLISTFPDWRSFGEWYERMVRMADEITPELEAKAAEVASGLGSEREKILALYNYVTALRYVAVPLGVNSLRPHAAASVLRNQYGDCKDKANLLNTLLRSLRIQADLVLVPRFEQAHESIPGLSFNHAISRVLLGKEILWLDTTDDICRFGLLPPGDPGRKVLVIDGKTAALEQLPQSAPEAHLLRLHGNIDATARGRGFPVSMVASATGYADYTLRNAARKIREHSSGVPLIAAILRPAAGVFALKKQTSTAVSALGENFCWSGEGTAAGLMSVNGSGVLLRAPFWLPDEWDLALHARKTPLFLNDGYPQTIEEEFQFVLPEVAARAVLPRDAAKVEGPLTWKIIWSQPAKNRISAKFRAQLRQGELTMADTTRIQQQLGELFAAMATVATLPLQEQEH